MGSLDIFAGPLRGIAAAGWGLFAALALLPVGYFFIFWDRRKEDSANKEDGQVGLKLVLFAFVLVGLAIAAGGLQTLIHYLASGAKTGKGNLKAGISSIVSGGAVLGFVLLMLVPRTNSAKFSQVERYTLGLIALLNGMAAILALSGLLDGLFTSMPWAANSGNLATIFVSGGLAFYAVGRFGSLSGWQAPAPRPVPMAPQGGGYPPQQQGYPPQQQGYPPQQQGYPPQQQGYPPQQQGYPPQQQGGGYPPQQGGGLPPPAGGGYPPR